MMDRRKFLGISAGAGGALALTPELLRALQRPGAFQRPAGKLIMRAIPSSGEQLPVVGLTLANHASCADPAALKEVLTTLVDNGGRLLDTYHGNDTSDAITATLAAELGIQDKLFWSSRVSPPGPPQPGAEVAKAHLEASLARYKVRRIDLAMVNVNADPSHFDAMKEAKKEGRVRYIGVSAMGDIQYAALESIMRTEPIDFIGTRFAIDYRSAEATILPLARERRIGVLAYFPFGGNGGVSCVASGAGLFARVGKRPLPEWAAEFDATTWAQFFIKYVVSHPAVTVVRGGTTKAKHMLDNIGGGTGRLPDEATRKRMAALIDALPPAVMTAQGAAAPLVLSAAILDRYVGEYRTAAGTIVALRRYGTMLVVKPGTNPETVIYPRSETRFAMGPNAIEFQLDSAGRTTGLVYEQDGRKIPASRVH